eukprot:7612292-Pyramimonas_sp.AAC.1
MIWRSRRGFSGNIIDPIIHRCPLFSNALGATPASNLAVDSLHTLYFGAVAKFCSAAVWRLLLMNVWGVRASTQEE